MKESLEKLYLIQPSSTQNSNLESLLTFLEENHTELKKNYYFMVPYYFGALGCLLQMISQSV